MLNYEPLGEIFSYRDKTWVALNPLILPVGQELELDLEPKGGRGENSTEEFKTLQSWPQPPPSFPSPARHQASGAAVVRTPPTASPPLRGVQTLRVSGLLGTLGTTGQRAAAKLGGHEGLLARKPLARGVGGSEVLHPTRSRNNNHPCHGHWCLPASVWSVYRSIFGEPMASKVERFPGHATSVQAETPCPPSRLSPALLQTQFHKAAPPHCLDLLYTVPLATSDLAFTMWALRGLL